MADTAGYKELKLIVKKAMWFAGAEPEDPIKYARFKEMAISVYRDLRLKHVKEGRIIEKVSVDTTLNTIDFPEQMLRYIGIAVVVDGEMVRLTRKDSINPTTTEVDAVETYDSTIGEGEDILEPYWYNFTTRGGINYDGYYYVDYPNKRFVLRNTTITQAWLLYITSGTHLDATTSIPVIYEDTIALGCTWMVNRFNWDMSENDRKYMKKLYEDSIIELRNFEIPTLEEISDTLDNLMHQGIRR